MRIVFMGTPDFAVPVLDEMMQAGYNVTLVVTQPDRQKGRGGAVAEPPVKLCAKKWGLPVFQPAKLRTEEATQRVIDEKPDVIVVAAFGQILSRQILELPRYGCINVHASLLPKYRGAAPIQWAVIDGEKESGVTIMQMNEGIDTGDILLQERILLADDETGESLYEKLSALGGRLLVQALPLLESGGLTATRQDDASSSYAGMLKKEMGNIDWTKSADEIERLIRGLNSWPSAYTFWNGRQLKLWAADVAKDAACADVAQTAGTILTVTKDAIHVQTGTGVLILKEVQLQGKKRMAVRDFLLGNHPVAGEVLTNGQ